VGYRQIERKLETRRWGTGNASRRVKHLTASMKRWKWQRAGCVLDDGASSLMSCTEMHDDVYV
jgi:hypothetical protein